MVLHLVAGEELERDGVDAVAQAGRRRTVGEDVAEMAADIDVDRARTAKERAEEDLRADSEDPEAKAALVRAEVRLTAAEAA